MFHVVTVHYKLDLWIEPQLRYLRRYLPSDTRVYAALNGIDTPLRSSFAYAADLSGTHPEKLNTLADIVSAQAAPDDYIIFIDGDAFPIAPIGPEILRGTPLAAVRRDENLGDPQPHPCFCITTVGFWNEIKGDWTAAGYTWTNTLGYRTSDVGGKLLGILRDANVQWRPLLRTNEVDLHHLWFAIYDDAVYHHGAGFRGRRARATLDLRRALSPSWLPVARRFDKHLALRSAVRRRKGAHQLLGREQAISDTVVRSILADEDFVQHFLAPGSTTEPIEDDLR